MSWIATKVTNLALDETWNKWITGSVKQKPTHCVCAIFAQKQLTVLVNTYIAFTLTVTY